MIIETKNDILNLVIEKCAETGMSERQLCAEAGVAYNTIYNLKKYPKRSVGLPTAIAILQTLGLKIIVEDQ